MAGVKVLVTTDGSNLSDKAIDTAIDLTKQLGGELIGMTSVVGEAPTGGFEAEDAAVRDRLAAISRKAAEKGVPCEVVAEHADAIWKGVLACAVRHDVSFIVMASRGLGSIGSAKPRRSCIRSTARSSSSANRRTRASSRLPEGRRSKGRRLLFVFHGSCRRSADARSSWRRPAPWRGT